MFHFGNNGRRKQYVPRPRCPPVWLAAMTPAGGDEGLDKSQHEGTLALFSYLRAQTHGASATKPLGNVTGVTFFTVTSAKTGTYLNLKGVADLYPSGIKMVPPRDGSCPTRLRLTKMNPNHTKLASAGKVDIQTAERPW